eukprot:GABV01006952.1.p1 GENE.GABV01006952.1~~GABV01006952.1.p1  ORF type:complete len:121 (-),score=34.67 GABV01006952.1:3-323(-)
MPCRYWLDPASECRRRNCDFLHEPSSLSRMLEIFNNARKSIQVCIFTLSCNEISEALIKAQKRGVNVRVITDDEQVNNRGSDIKELAGVGIPVHTDQGAAALTLDA